MHSWTLKSQLLPIGSRAARFDFDFWCFNATFNNISAI
jgi:hypothetical protein